MNREIYLDVYSNPDGSFAFASIWVHFKKEDGTRGCLHIPQNSALKFAQETAEGLAFLTGAKMETRKYTLQPEGGAK